MTEGTTGTKGNEVEYFQIYNATPFVPPTGTPGG